MSSESAELSKENRARRQILEKKNTIVFFLVIGGFKPMQANKLFRKEIGVDFAPWGFRRIVECSPVELSQDSKEPSGGRKVKSS